MTRISNVRKTTKFKRSIKAISPIIATLLMIAIAVVASLVVYAWVTGYIGGATTKAGNAIQIQSFASSGGKLVIYVQNVGQGVAELKSDQSVYVNGDLVTVTDPTGTITIPEGQTVQLITNAAYSGENVNIKVTTTGGTFTESTGTGGSGGSISTSLTCLAPDTIAFGEDITSAGTLNYGSSGISGKTVTITYQLSGHADVVHTQTTDSSGAYSDSYIPNVAGAWSVTAKFAGDSTYPAASSASQPITVIPSGTVATKLVFASGDGQILMAGDVSNAITVQRQDNTNTPVATGTSAITVTLTQTSGAFYSDSSGNTAITQVTIPAGSSLSDLFYFKDTNVGTPTLTASYSGLTSATTQFTINAAPTLDHFTIATISSPQTTGTAYSITITAIDQYGATLTSYTGNPALSSTSWSGNQNLGAFSSGTKTGSVTSNTAGPTSITATDGSKTGSSNTFTVSNAAPALDHFNFATISSPQTTGSAYSITITAIDQYGATLTSYTGNPSLTSTSWTGNLQLGAFASGTKTGTVTSTITGLTSITATDGSKTGTSNTFTVSAPAVATKLVFTAGAGQSLTAGTTSPTAIVVQRQDASGNPISTGTSAITVALSTTSSGGGFYSNSGGTTLITTISIAAGSSSSAGFYYKDTVAATPTLTGASSGLTSATTQFTISAATASVLSVSGFPSPVTAGTAGSVTVTAKDAYGNTATSYRGTVHFTSSDAGSPTLPANYAFAAGDNGVHTFTNGVTLKTAGTQSITSTDTVTGSITGSQTSITVNPGALASFTITGYPTSVTAGSAFGSNVIVTAYDSFGNVKTDYAGAVYFASTDAQATLPFTSASKYTFTGSGTGKDNGAHTFAGSSFTLKTVGSGTQTVSVTDGTVSKASNAITVNAAAASQLAFTVAPSSIPRNTRTMYTVQLQDQYGNPTTRGSDTSVTLVDNTGYGSFYQDANGGQAITSITITSGTNSVNFYWTCTNSGTYTLTVSYTGLTSDTASVTVT